MTPEGINPSNLDKWPNDPGGEGGEKKPSSENSNEGEPGHEADREVNDEVATRFEEEFNISKEELNTVDGFSKLSEDQQRLVLDNFRELTLNRIEEEGIKSFREDRANSGVLGSMWKGFLSSYYKAEAKAEAGEKLIKGGIDVHRDVLTDVVEQTKESGLSLDASGELRFAQTLEGMSEQEVEVIEQFNQAAQEFANTSSDWKYEDYLSKTFSGSEREDYEQKLEQYENALEDYVNIAESSDELAVEDVMEADKRVRFNQFFSSDQDYEEAIQMIKDEPKAHRIFNNVAANKGSYFAMGGIGRSLSAGVLGYAAAPVVAATLAAYRGRQDAIESLEDEAVARQGGADSTITRNVGGFGVESTGLAEKQADVINAVSAENLNGKLKRLLDVLDENVDTPDESLSEEDAEAMLRRRVQYTKKKLDDGLVDFGEAESRAGNQYQLLQTLSEAQSVTKLKESLDIEDDIKARLDRFLEYKDDKTRRYVHEKTAQGALMGATFASFGTAVAEFWSGDGAEIEGTGNGASAGGSGGSAGGGESPDTSEASGLAGGTQPDSTSFDPNDPMDRMAASLPGGQPVEPSDIAGGGSLSDLSPEDQQKALESTFGVSWWKNPDQLGSDEREFLNKMLSGDPPEWWQDLLDSKTEASTSELTDGQRQVVESVFADDWLDFSERTQQQEEFIESFLGGSDVPDGVDTTTDTSQQPFGGSDTNQTSGAAGDFPGGELDGPESGVQGGDEMAEQKTESSPVNEAAQPGHRVDVVDPSEGLWSSAEEIVESGDITRDQFMEAWGNPDSTVMIGGEEKHISQVDLVHRGDTLVYVPGEDGDPPRFELDTASGQEAGLDLPGEAAEDQGVEAAESEPASGQQPELAGGDLSDVNKVDPAGLAVEDFDVPEHVDGVTADSKPANGITKGAIHSYTKALAEPAYNPEYLSDLQIPDSMSEQQFAQHINELNELDQPLQHLSDIAANEPEKYQAMQTLFESYAEANMTPLGVDVSETADLEGLYDAVERHINENAPAPEPPSDGGADVASDQGSVAGKGREAEVDTPDDNTSGTVTGEGRGAEVDYSGDAETAEPSGHETMNTDTQMTAEEMESIIDASDNGRLETYPRDLAAKLSISDAEGLQVSQNGLTELIDTLPPQSEYSTMTEAIQDMDKEGLENLYEITEYHENNHDWLEVKNSPSFEDEVDPLQNFIDSQYQELTGESIHEQLDLNPDAGINPAEAYDLSGITEVPANMSDPELLTYAQADLADGEVFRSGDSLYVYIEEAAQTIGKATDMAPGDARGALSQTLGENIRGSYLEQRSITETADGDKVGVLMEMPLN
jgi:tetratricopeptide (TPR) repeat protein